ncbi:hypothetical protein TRAPUB_1014 [Trametes pubescens]|uniref:Uncharacterized protein n=1 Tax=Trametes pubescens TaxID=154538 RepID=A0A1M2VKE9_TRAPU|nr:hypothetical protein TRAPUB_1014 [Trametes pubescens]
MLAMISWPSVVRSLALLVFASACAALTLVDPTKSPRILRPNGADVWTVGDVATIRWSNDGLSITTEVGRLLLGFENPDNGQTMEFPSQPLADGFALADGVLNVIVPAVPTGNFYWIALTGNAANQSPLFSIVNPAAPTEGTPGNITFPVSLAVSAAPEATVSHTSSAGSPSSSSVGTTMSPALTSAVASPSTTSSGSSAACRRTVDSSLGWLLTSLLGLATILVV